MHYQIPASADVYVHRCGRTARAAEDGLAVALVTPREAPRFTALLRVGLPRTCLLKDFGGHRRFQMCSCIPGDKTTVEVQAQMNLMSASNSANALVLALPSKLGAPHVQQGSALCLKPMLCASNFCLMPDQALERGAPLQFPLDPSLLPACRARVRLALRLDAHLRSRSKSGAEAAWLRANAEAAGIQLSDDEDADEDAGRAGTRSGGTGDGSSADEIQKAGSLHN